MRIKEFDELKAKIRPFLSKYLSDNQIDVSKKKFTCPNRKVHERQDATPSASFFPDDDHWNCFVCEGAGDIFSAAYYLENKPLRGVEFITDNVLYLAKKYNIDYSIIEETSEDKHKKELYRVLELIVKFSYVYLRKKKFDKVITYLERRNWLDLTEHFLLGYTNSRSLLKFLEKKNISRDLMKDAGINIVITKSGREVIPLVENRILIPVRNYFGKISSIISRRIYKDMEPKYLWSKNSIVHVKSNDLFNLSEAKKYSKDLYVVESNASVLSMYQNNLKNVIALSGKEMNDEQYNLLVRFNINKIILCLDNDNPGLEATKKIIYNYRNKYDLEILVKELPKDDSEENKALKDPDDFIEKYGVEKFINFPELTTFNWILNKFVDDDKNEKYKEILFANILTQKNFLKRERLIKKFASKTDFTQKTVIQELERYSNDLELLTSVKEVINAKESLIEDVNKFEEKAWSRTGELLGLDTGWPIFNKIIDGFQSGFYIIGGRTNIGKSAFMLSLALNLIEYNQNKVYVLYFNIDDPKLKSISRLIALKSKIPINWIKNPKYKIKLNEDLTEDYKNELLKQRDDTLNYIKSLTASFAIKDVNRIEDIVYLTRLYNKIAINDKKKLVVFLDKIHNVKARQRTQGKRDLIDLISLSLKELCNKLGISVMGSFEVVKSSIMRRPTEEDIKETQKLEDDSDAAIFLYNEQKIQTDTMLVFTENDKVYPIVEVIVPKNKLNDLSGYDVKDFFRFYSNFSLMKECSIEEQKKYLEIGS